MTGPNGYILGVDLGTSHTVAVIRWPDGRSRPLLVDGAPVMPSAVFVDESGHTHVGRDAHRLAQTDPSRYEPNPKHRIGEETILLGDREVPTVTLLTAILRNVAAKAVEAVGHLPPAVLTYPAKWGSSRRAILEDAAARAGFPPVKLVPEPVAAAHYFAEVMRQPIPQGASVAVFDFGGGTLDIAVVRHEPDGTFAVLADGGLDDLGGLDVDAALVAHLGQTIQAHVPQVWSQLSNPSNGTDRRNRRLFWDDVRGAKEMLSRTTVAPVPVPGVDSALHLTREELERLAGPLLERAVAETQRVIAQAGQTPERLAGLFLVGGASRIPLVSRLLHARLGIAPTVLEQPEIPVAEGSLAAGFPQQGAEAAPPVSSPPGAPVSPQAVPTSLYTPPPGTPGFPPPGGPNEQGFLSPPPPPKPWYKKKTTWIGVGAAVVVLALFTAWLLYDPYPRHPMNTQLQQVGEEIPYATESPRIPRPALDGDVAYYVTEESESASLTAVDLTTGKELWRSDPFTTGTTPTVHAARGILYTADDGGDGVRLIPFDTETGAKLTEVRLPDGEDDVFIVGERIVVFERENAKVVGYDASGKEQWAIDVGIEATSMGHVPVWDAFAAVRGSYDFDDSGRVYVRDDDGSVVLIDVAAGETVTEKRIGADRDVYGAYESTVFVASGDDGYTLTAYDADDGLAQLGTVRPDSSGWTPAYVWPCGETRVCVHEASVSDTLARVTVVDTTDGLNVVWQSPDDRSVLAAEPVGETLSVSYDDEESPSSSVTQLYDADFEPIGSAQDGTFTRIDSGSLLNLPHSDDAAYSPTDVSFTGLGARDGTVYQLGTQQVYEQCAATAEYLTCGTDTGIRVWRFRG